MSKYLYHDEPIAGAPSSADRVVYKNETVESALDTLSETIEESLSGLKLYRGTMTRTSDSAGRIKLIDIPQDAIGITLNIIDGKLLTLTAPTLFTDNSWYSVLRQDTNTTNLANTSVTFNYSYWK